MANASSTITVTTSSNFNWTAQIQYHESLSTRDEAILYASRYGCNLIVKYERRPGPQFDVLKDPNLASTVDESCETVERVPVVVEPERIGWSRLMLRGVFGLVKRLGAPSNLSQQKAMSSAQSQPVAAK